MALGADISAAFFRLKAAVTLTIASGVLTATQSLILVNGEGSANDDLATINVDTTLLMPAGYTEVLLLKAAGALTITVKHGTGNISLASGADFSLTGQKTLMLVRMSSSVNWNDIAGSN